MALQIGRGYLYKKVVNNFVQSKNSRIQMNTKYAHSNNKGMNGFCRGDPISNKSPSDLKSSLFSQMNRVPMQSIENLPSKRILESPNKRTTELTSFPKKMRCSVSPKIRKEETNDMLECSQSTVQQLIDELWMIQKQLDFVKDFTSDGRIECDSIRRYLLNAPQKDIIINFEQIKSKVAKLQEQLSEVK